MEPPTGLLERALDAMPNQVAVLDEDGVIVWTNRAWGAFGEANEITGDPSTVGVNYLGVCGEAEGDHHAATAAAELRDLLAGDSESFSLEYPCHSPDERRWFTMRAVRFDHAGERYVLMVHLDITDRKLAELRVGEQNDQLQGVTSMLSHDLRNPLSVAMGNLELLEEADEDRRTQIRHSLERMETIIEDALVLAGTDEPDQLQPVDLGAAARRAWSQVSTDEAGLSVETDRTVRADQSMLANVFENLFRNAVEHAGAAARVTVGATDGGFYVADDGPGIPADEREAVFESGFSTGEGGSGFGLAIVRRVCQAHGWTVVAGESEKGGARFEVTGVEALE